MASIKTGRMVRFAFVGLALAGTIAGASAVRDVVDQRDRSEKEATEQELRLAHHYHVQVASKQFADLFATHR